MLPGIPFILEERRLIFRSTLVLALALTLPMLDWRPAPPPSIHPVIGTLQPDGDVRVRPSQSLRWEEPTDGVPIRVWDTIATGSTGKATVTLEERDLDQNVRVRLPPDSVVRFRSADSTVDLSFLQLQGKLDAAAAKARRFGSDKPFEFLAKRTPRAPLPPPLDLSKLKGLPPLAEPPPALPFQAVSDRLWRILQRPLPELPLVAATGKTVSFDPDDYVLRLTAPSKTPKKGDAPPVKATSGRFIKFRWTPIPFREIAYDLRIESLDEGLVREYRSEKPFIEVQLGAPGRYKCSILARNKGEPMTTVSVMVEVLPGEVDENDVKADIFGGETDE